MHVHFSEKSKIKTFLPSRSQKGHCPTPRAMFLGKACFVHVVTRDGPLQKPWSGEGERSTKKQANRKTINAREN